MANWNKKNIKRLLLGDFSVKRLMESLIFIYTFLCFYGCFFSERLIFQSPASSQSDSREVIKVGSANGVKISTVHFPNPQLNIPYFTVTGMRKTWAGFCGYSERFEIAGLLCLPMIIKVTARAREILLSIILIVIAKIC